MHSVIGAGGLIAPGVVAPPADVWWNGEFAQTLKLRDEGVLATEAPTAEDAVRQLRYDPRGPVPTVARVCARVPVTGPHDQTPVEAPHVLVFTTPRLATPPKIVGQIPVKL